MQTLLIMSRHPKIKYSWTLCQCFITWLILLLSLFIFWELFLENLEKCFTKNKKIISFSQVFISIVLPYLKQLKIPPRLRYFFNKITSVHSKSPNILWRHSPRVLIIASDLSARPASGIQRSCNKISKIEIDQSLNLICAKLQKNSLQESVCVLMV